VARKKAEPPKSSKQVAARPIKSKKATDATLDRFQLRLPDGMRNKLAEAAIGNGRSLDSEIIYRLAKSLEREENQKKLSDHLKVKENRLAKVEGEIAALVEQLRRD
jgi:hypothetical protein